MIPPTSGELASGLIGEGRMEEPEKIVDFIEKDLIDKSPLNGKTVLITAGPTIEMIDKVRFISPVKVGSFIRLKSKILKVIIRNDNSVLVRIERLMEMKGIKKLAMYAETLSLMYSGDLVN